MNPWVYVILAKRFAMTPMEVDALPPGAVALLLSAPGRGGRMSA